MNRIERAAGQVSLTPLQGQTIALPVACTPTLGIFFAAASASYLYNRNQNLKGFTEDGETDLIGSGLSLGELSGDELIAARRAQSAR